MTLRNSLFAVSGKASFLDARRDMSGLFVCNKTTMKKDAMMPKDDMSKGDMKK
jgi:hypothetical protein